MFFLVGSCEKDEETAQFKLATTVSPAEGGSISITEGSFASGRELTITAIPSQGYVFKNWSGAITGDQNPIKVVFNTDKNISANFERMDTDGDGVPDNIDQCNQTAAGQTVDAQGCSEAQKDSDGDGVPNSSDTCANTPSGETVDENGCSDDQNGEDSDGDGITDNLDECPGTPTGETVDNSGCSESQEDADNDGIPDSSDTCDATPEGETVDENGCSDSQRDTDGDGINDDVDVCDETPSGAPIDATGCSDIERDTDGDGVPDANDQCPETEEGVTVNEEGCPPVARTYLPDDSFEQQLIDLGYDDVLDGFVNTENIITVSSLNLNGIDREVTDLTGLEGFVSLTTLFIGDMTTTTIDLSNHPQLVTFSARFSEVEQLLADSLENLEVIANDGSSIANAIITDCPKLAEMSMRDSYYGNLMLADIPLVTNLGGIDDISFGVVRVENCSSFQNIFASSVASLEIISCESITTIFADPQSFGSFGLGGLTLSSNPNLTEIDVQNAALNFLNISDSDAINSITLGNNTIASLDISTLPALENLSVAEANLACIQVSQGQLDAIPTTWSVGASQYSLDCTDQ